jgi:hypothetical protein
MVWQLGGKKCKSPDNSNQMTLFVLFLPMTRYEAAIEIEFGEGEVEEGTKLEVARKLRGAAAAEIYY